MKNAIFLVVIAIVAFFFFSYRLTEVPSGMTIDEASIGYNAVLIGKTLRDETGRFFPIFTLTINGSDWKQPSSIYAATVIFKIIGASVYNLRLISVVAAVTSLILVVYLNYLLLGKLGAILSGVFFATSPIVVMHSHLAQENIMPVPFIIGWLITIFLFQKQRKGYFLFLSGLILGASIYSYKGMRAIVPPLFLTTLLYLWFDKVKTWHGILFFCLGVSPFVLIMPWLNIHYAGALFDSQGFFWRQYHDFLYFYLSNFDLSSLFIKGDSTAWHSTGLHGVFLVSTLPIFIIGQVSAFREKNNNRYYLFLLASFFLAPLLLGQVGQVHRFSRLLVLVPFFVTFCTLGFLKIKNKILIFLVSILITLNFIDFIKYYWFTYPAVTKQHFGQNTEIYYQELTKLSKEKSVPAYIFIDDYNWQGEDAHFYGAANFDNNLGKWKPGDKIPSGSLLMARLGALPGFHLIESGSIFNYFTKD